MKKAILLLVFVPLLSFTSAKNLTDNTEKVIFGCPSNSTQIITGCSTECYSVEVGLTGSLYLDALQYEAPLMRKPTAGELLDRAWYLASLCD
ncbi:MAG: hypothetical protein NWQ19_08435 [Nonlabens sp.]|nr:hypothetical protein [Nonlabens sp.]